MKKFILASGSPRRKEILLREGYSFEIVTSDKEDAFDKNCPAEKFSVRCALSKARDVYSRVPKTSVVLGADTVVYFGGKIIGKPKDEKEAKRYLQMLSGKTHTVVTGYAVLSANKRVIGHDVSHVTFNVLPGSLINDYVATGKPLDKAGAYGLQDGFDLVSRYEGSYWNIVGLPIERIEKELKNFK